MIDAGTPDQPGFERAGPARPSASAVRLDGAGKILPALPRLQGQAVVAGNAGQDVAGGPLAQPVAVSSQLQGFTEQAAAEPPPESPGQTQDRKSTRLNSSHVAISYAVFCLK